MIEKKFLSALQDVTNKVNTAADKTGKKVEEFDWSVVLPQWKKLFCEVANA